MKSSNILLDKEFNARLSDFGLAKLGPVGDNTHVSTRVVGTYGYCAPEYAMSGKLTVKSDIYSFGVVLLELVTGCKAIDFSRKNGEQNLVVWVSTHYIHIHVCNARLSSGMYPLQTRPYIMDRKNFFQIVDPLLEGKFSRKSMQHLISITAMCLQANANSRPAISDIVDALEYIASRAEDPRRSRSFRSRSRGRAIPQPPAPQKSN